MTMRISAILLVAVLLPCTVAPGQEPIYRGRLAAQWAGVLGERNQSLVGRLEAVDALAALKQSGPLLAALGDSDALVRAAAATALGRLRESKAIAPLTKALDDEDANVRLAAADALAAFGPRAAAALPRLRALAEDREQYVRHAAWRAVLSIGPTTAEQDVARLLTRLRGDADERFRAVEALGRLGPKAKDVERPLAVALRDADVTVRAAAATALRRIGPTEHGIAALLRALSDREPSVRLAAARALRGTTSVNAEVLSGLGSAVCDENILVREVAADALAGLGKGAVKELRPALRHPKAVVRRLAVETLGRLGPTATVPLTSALVDDDLLVRCRAARALGRIGTGASGAVPALAVALRLRETDAGFRREVALALGHVSAGRADAVPALMAVLKDADGEVVSQAMEALVRVGRPATARVLEAARSRDEVLALRAAEILRRLRTDAVPAIVAALLDPDPRVRSRLIRILGRIGPAAKAAVPALERALADRDTSVSLTAAHALGEIGPDAATATTGLVRLIDGPNRLQALRSLAGIGRVPAGPLSRALTDKDDTIRMLAASHLRRHGQTGLLCLRAALRHPDVHVRRSAAGSLGEWGPGVAPALRAALADSDAGVRLASRDSLMRVGDPAVVVPACVAALHEGTSVERQLACILLRRFAPHARAALPLLKKAVGEKDERVRWQAALALAEIDPASAEVAVPTLAGRLFGSDHGDSVLAAEALARLGRRGIAELRKAAQGKETALRRLVMEILERQTPPAAEAVPVLALGLRDEDDVIRAVAAHGLARRGERGVPALVAALELRSIEVIQALARLGPLAAPALGKALASGNVNVRRHAAYALSRMGAEAEAALPELTRALSDREQHLRLYAALVLKEIGRAAAPAARPLAKLLDDPDRDTFEAAAHALSAIGSPGRPALEHALAKAPQERRSTLLHALARARQEPAALAAALRHPDWELRYRVAAQLPQMNPRPIASALVPPLTEALRDGNEHVREAAARALKHLGPAAGPAAVRLAALLNDKRPEVVLAAAEALAALGPASAPAFEALCETLKSPNLGSSVIEALVRMETPERTVPVLARMLGEKGTNRPVRAARALQRMGPAAHAAVPALTDALTTPDNTLLEVTLEALAAVGPRARLAVPALARLVGEHKQYPIRLAAARALGRVGPDAWAGVPALIRALKDDSPEVRREAAEALWRIGPAASAATGALAELLPGADSASVTAAFALASFGDSGLSRLFEAMEDPRRHARGVAALGLGAAGHDAIPPLARALSHPDVDHRPNAIRGLERLAPWSRAAVAALTEAAEYDVVHYQPGHCLETLAWIGAPGVVEPLLRQLGSTEPERRARAAEALSRLPVDVLVPVAPLRLAMRDKRDNVRRWAVLALAGRDPDRGLRRLRAALRDGSSEVRRGAIDGLRRLGADGVLGLIGALEDGDSNLRFLAAESLGKIGPAAGAATPALGQALRQPTIDGHRSVLAALERIGPDGVPVLKLALNDPAGVDRVRAAAALAAIGPPAREALPNLRRLLRDPSPEVRKAARDAVARIAGRTS